MKIPSGANLGTKYGSLTVQSVLTYGRKASIRFICECGSQHDALLSVVKTATKSGTSPMCKGCLSVLKTENGMRRFDLTTYMQKRYGRLLVTGISQDATRKNVKSRLVCLCDCGGQSIVSPMQLTRGKTTSCGCFHTERLTEVGKENVVHGHTTFGVLNGRTPVYEAWLKIKAGCAEGWRAGFHLVCHEYDPRWQDFQEFWKDFGDIGIRQTVSRIDNKMTWSKENCFINVGRRGAKTVGASIPIAIETKP